MLTNLYLEAQTASGLGVNTRMQLLRIDDTPTASVEVTGSPTTTLTTGVLHPFTEGDLVLIAAGVQHANGDTTSKIYVNGDTTGSNYTRGYQRSGGAGSTTAGPINFISNADEWACGAGFLGFNANANGLSLGMMTGAKVTVSRARDWHIRHADTSLTEVQVTSDMANGLAVGSWLKLWKLN